VAVTRWTIPRVGQVEAVVPAAPEEVYAVVADVTRIGEWSHECRGAEWLGGSTSASVGALFRGTNKVNRFGWSRICTVTAAEPGRSFAYRTSGGLPPDSTAWSFDLHPHPGGTRVVQRYEILRFARPVEVATYAFVPAHRDRRPALLADLERLGEVSAASR
jgi:Polyketide cyclase / dehydrase and lipid transport